MTHRQYDSGGVASVYSEVRPSPTEELVKAIIDQLGKSCPPGENGKWSRAVDVGCGSGQATFLLAEYFDQVMGFDISEPQLKEAQRRNKFANVSFRISPGEEIPLEEGSVQLITVCEALHFFDIQRFNAKVDSLLCPGGLFVAIGYYPAPVFTRPENPSEHLTELSDLIERPLNMWQEHGLPVQIFKDQILTKYRCIDLPFDRVCHEATFKTILRRPASYVIDLINSLGTSETFRQREPEKEAALMKGIHDDLHRILGTNDLSSIELNVTFEYFIICFKK